MQNNFVCIFLHVNIVYAFSYKCTVYILFVNNVQVCIFVYINNVFIFLYVPITYAFFYMSITYFKNVSYYGNIDNFDAFLLCQWRMILFNCQQRLHFLIYMYVNKVFLKLKRNNRSIYWDIIAWTSRSE